MSLKPILNLNQVSKSFPSGKSHLTVLDEISITVQSGESVAIVGPSGSGKTTLLGICAGLDTPSRGEIDFENQSMNALSEEARAQLRMKHVGFVFQNFQLIQSLKAWENVAIPLELLGKTQAKQTAKEWLDRVGLGDRTEHYPLQLSGGEQQRVAIARACVHGPKLLFADEPTGNLDPETSQHIEDLLFETHRNTGNTLIVVTHDYELANRTDRILHLKQGRLNHDAA